MATLAAHIPKEITEYKEKIIGGILTLRQLAGLSGAVLAGGLVYAVCHFRFGLDAQQSSIFIIAAAAIPGVFGFIPIHDMDPEQYLLLRYRHWQRSAPIPYKTDSDRGESRHVPLPKKAKSRKRRTECVTQFRTRDRRRERRCVRAARRHIRATVTEIRRSERAFCRRLKA